MPPISSSRAKGLLRPLFVLITLGGLVALAAYGPARSARSASAGLKRLAALLRVSPALQDQIPPPNSLQASGKIAFSSNRDGNLEIYVMNPDGTGQTNLTN